MRNLPTSPAAPGRDETADLTRELCRRIGQRERLIEP